MAGSLMVANERFSREEAEQVIATYCFEDEPTHPTPPPQEYGPPPAPWRRPAMGYRSYDCQRGPGDGMDIVDIVAPVLLNVVHGYGVEMISNLLAVAPLVNETVRGVPSHLTFWTIPTTDIANPAEASPAWLLHRAWYLLESVPNCAVTKTHKILHHAWPHLFPLIDNDTRHSLGENMWLTIRRDLDASAEEFSILEAWFAGTAAAQGGVALTRLRLYDILLWWRVHDQQG